MCEVRSSEKRPRNKKKYNGQQQKEMDCHEPHPAPIEKMQGIQWTERPTGALVAAGSLWPTSTQLRHALKFNAQLSPGPNSPNVLGKFQGCIIQTGIWEAF
jgi:hypothetical protein